MPVFVRERPQFEDANGEPVVNGTVYFGQANQDPQTNPVAVWADANYTIGIGSSVQLDSLGRPTQKVYLRDADIPYSYRVLDRNDVQVEEDLNATGISVSAGGAPPGSLQQFYIKAVQGTALKGGVGVLRVEARSLTATADTLLTAGTLQLYVGTVVVTAANGYVSGSDGYTGILDATDINGSVVVELKDGPTGTVRDSITLVDVLDGVGTDAIYASVESSNGLAWAKGPDNGAWLPALATTDLTATFYQGGAEAAQMVARASLNQTNGTIAGSIITPHPDIQFTVTNNATGVITLNFEYQGVQVSESVHSVLGGSIGPAGPSAVQYQIRPTNGTAIKNGVGDLTIEAREIQGGINNPLTTGSIRLYASNGQEITEANGYGTGSNGFTGVIGPSNITDSLTVFLRDTNVGEIYDSVTLIDIQDGTASNATVGSIDASNGIAFVRAPNDGAWTPGTNTTDLTVIFYQGGTQVATEAVQVTLNEANGTLSAAITGVDDANVVFTVQGGGTSALTVQFQHVPSGIRVSEQVIASRGGAQGPAGPAAVQYEARPVNGTAIQNGIGTLTVEAHQITGAGDVHLSTGTIRLYVGSTEVTVANGFAAGSDGFTGVFDSGDINNSVLVEIKDGPSGTVLDTVTLIDVADGTASNATFGSVTSSNGLAWNRAINAGSWTPAANTTDLTCTFFQGGASIATETVRATLDTITGNITVALEGADDANVTFALFNDNTAAVTIEWLHVPSGERVSERVVSVQGGMNGADAVVYIASPTMGTAIKNGNGGPLQVQALLQTAAGQNPITSGTIRLYDENGDETTPANGYDTGSTGFLAIVPASKIVGSMTLSLRDGPSGTIYDTVTLVDVLDGLPVVVGSWEHNNTLGYSRTEGGSWLPNASTTTLICRFYRSGVQIASRTVEVALNQTAATMQGSSLGADGEATTLVFAGQSGSQAMTITATHTASGAVVSERLNVVTSGAPGTDGVVVQLSNDNVTLSANADGTGYSLVSAGGTMQVIQGTVQVNSGVTYAVIGGGTKNGLTMAISGAGVYTLSGANWTSDNEVFTLRATYQSQVYDRQYTISKARAGTDGGGGVTVTQTQGSEQSASTLTVTHPWSGNPLEISWTASRDSLSASIPPLTRTVSLRQDNVGGTLIDQSIVPTDYIIESEGGQTNYRENLAIGKPGFSYTPSGAPRNIDFLLFGFGGAGSSPSVINYSLLIREQS